MSRSKLSETKAGGIKVTVPGGTFFLDMSGEFDNCFCFTFVYNQNICKVNLCEEPFIAFNL